MSCFVRPRQRVELGLYAPIADTKALLHGAPVRVRNS
jgi:hypothetical protein